MSDVNPVRKSTTEVEVSKVTPFVQQDSVLIFEGEIKDQLFQLGEFAYKKAQKDSYLKQQLEPFFSQIEKKERKTKDIKESATELKSSPNCCPKCNYSVLEGGLFCMNCGLSLVGVELKKQVTCANCGKSIDENAVYCEHCGEMQKEYSSVQCGIYESAVRDKTPLAICNEKPKEELEAEGRKTANRVLICKKCGAEIKAGWKFCGSCGSSQEQG